MMALKQESERINSMDEGNENNSGIITNPGLPPPSTIHMGSSIMNAGSNETISIVIPLSGGISILPNRIDECSSLKESFAEDTKEIKLEMLEPDLGTNMTGKSRANSKQQRQQRTDKTKGCPFPTCSRYGRAFSRAHDLKRHIARHEMRKERLVEATAADVIPTCSQCGESFLNAAILERHARSHLVKQEHTEYEFRPPVILPSAAISSTTSYRCVTGKKMYAQESKLKKPRDNNVCTICGCLYDREEELRTHMIEHGTNMSRGPNKTLDKSVQAEDTKRKKEMKRNENMVEEEEEGARQQDKTEEKVMEEVKDENEREDDEDEYMLEEMLLLKKNPRIQGLSSGEYNSSVAAGTAMVVARGTAAVGATSNPCSPATNNNANKIRCDYCSKTFKTKWTLSSHVAAHEGRFQFGCARCGKKFVRKSHFEGHVRSHEAARPYVCEQCGKTFKELKHRREHTKRKHPGNQNAIQNLLDSISACVSAEESAVEPTAKFTLLMPINFAG